VILLKQFEVPNENNLKTKIINLQISAILRNLQITAIKVKDLSANPSLKIIEPQQKASRLPILTSLIIKVEKISFN
jgi:hypothetical protein